MELRSGVQFVSFSPSPRRPGILLNSLLRFVHAPTPAGAKPRNTEHRVDMKIGKRTMRSPAHTFDWQPPADVSTHLHCRHRPSCIRHARSSVKVSVHNF